MQLARPPQRRRPLARIASAVVPGALRPYPRSRLTRWRGGLVATRSPNEERALAPILGTQPDLRPVRGNAVPGAAVLEPATASTRRRIDAFLAQQGRSELRASWHHAAHMTARELRRLAALDLTGCRFLLISRQTHPLLRALILTAERQGVPVVYLPHSPLTRFQIDLPVSYAALRGEAERDWVVANADASPNRIAVVGNPATDVTRLAPRALRLPGVLAVSPDPEPALRRLIGMLTDAGLSEVILAPHPRSDLAMLERLLPDGWTLHRAGLTVNLLALGPRWVIQCSSGIAWESAVLGIPTGDVRLDDRQPDYPLLEDPVFPVLRSTDDVRIFAATSASADRDELRAHARAWCATDGRDAVARVTELLSQIGHPGERIVDAWAPGGVLHRRSPLAEL